MTLAATEKLLLFLCYFLIFTAGSCVFSFLNVIVFRVPRGERFMTGRSHCPGCGRTLSPGELIPIWSYLLLRGKCRTCGSRIGYRDVLVEVLGGVFGVLCAWQAESVAACLTRFAFLSVLTVVALLDWDTMEIPDQCHIAAALLAVAACFTTSGLTIPARLIGAVCVSLPMLLLALATNGFGGGDIKLMAACGLFLGWKLTLLSAFFGFLAGGGYGIYLLASGKKGRKERFAFGPFLCLGMMLALFWGQNVLDWYLNLFMF